MAANGGRVGVALNKRGANCFQNSGQILIDIAIPETKNPEFSTPQIIVANLISDCVLVVIMLTAIDLDNKPIFQTYEIDNEIMPGCLTAEMESF